MSHFSLEACSSSYLRSSEISASRWYAIAAFLLTSILLTPLAFIGLDVTDTGFHLTNQLIANDLGIRYAQISPLWWFSDTLGGWWLRLTMPWGLVGARLGGVLAYSVCAAICMRLSLRVFTPSFKLLWGILLAVLITARPSSSGSLIILDYYIVPMLLGLLLIWAFIEHHARPSNALAALVGILLGILILSRITTISFLVLPLIGAVICYRYRRSTFSAYVRSCSIIYFAFALVIGCVAFEMWRTGSLVGYIEALSLDDERHLASDLLLYGRQLIKLKYVLGIVALATIVGLLIGTRWRDALIFVGLMLILISAYLPADIVVDSSKSLTTLLHRWHQLATELRILLYGTIFCGLILLFRQRLPREQLILLFACALLLPLGIGLGSDTGLSKCGYGVWLLATLSVVLASGIYSQCVLGFITLTCALTFYYPVYRDSMKWPWAVLQTTSLSGAVTSQYRQRSLDETLQVLSRYVSQEERILAYPYVPLIYFASSTRPIVSTPWLELLPTERIRQELASLSDIPLPFFIVRAKIIAYHPGWPNEPREHGESVAQKTKLMDDWLFNSHKPSLIWSNGDFEIWRSQMATVHRLPG